LTSGQFQSNQGQPLISQVMRTDNAWERLRGLLGRPQLQVDDALWISPCNSVHCFFMSYPIDLVYLDQHQAVIKTVADLHPWRFSACLKARSVIELAAGTIAKLGIAPGTSLVWQPCDQ